MSEKTFGQVACEAVHPHWKAQCEQKPILQLPSAEKIAEAIYSIYGDKWPNASDHDKSICMREATAVLDLLQAKPRIGVDIAAPNQDLTVITNRKTNHHETIMRMQQKTYPACKGTNCGCTDGMSHSKECIAEYAAATKMPLEPEQEKKVETEQQYQERLLRALRSFG